MMKKHQTPILETFSNRKIILPKTRLLQLQPILKGFTVPFRKQLREQLREQLQLGLTSHHTVKIYLRSARNDSCNHPKKRSILAPQKETFVNRAY